MEIPKTKQPQAQMFTTRGTNRTCLSRPRTPLDSRLCSESVHLTVSTNTSCPPPQAKNLFTDGNKRTAFLAVCACERVLTELLAFRREKPTDTTTPLFDRPHPKTRWTRVTQFLQRQGVQGGCQHSIPFVGVIPRLQCLVLGRGARTLRQVRSRLICVGVL